MLVGGILQLGDPERSDDRICAAVDGSHDYFRWAAGTLGRLEPRGFYCL